MSDSSFLPIAETASCPCRGSTLDKLLQPAILAVLAEGPAHGYGLAERIAALPLLHGRKPDTSGVYHFLRAMERRGLVVAAWDLSERGPAKRAYQLTAEGRECLRRWVETLKTYRREIGELLSIAEAAMNGAAARAADGANCESSVREC